MNDTTAPDDKDQVFFGPVTAEQDARLADKLGPPGELRREVADTQARLSTDNGKDGEPKSAAERQRAKRERDALEAEAAAASLPLHLRINPAEECDAARVFHYARGRLLRVMPKTGDDYVMVGGSDGLWTELSVHRSSSISALLGLLRDARAEAIADMRANHPDLDELADKLEATWHDNARQWYAVARHVIVAAGDPEAEGIEAIPEQELNAQRPGYIPLAGGGALDLKTGERLDRDETLALRLRGCGWVIPMPEPGDYNIKSRGADAMRDAIHGRDGKPGRYKDVFERLSAGLAESGKFVDVIVAPESNYGKTTIYDMLLNAFPGSVASISGKNSFSAQGARFDALKQKLSSGAWLVFIDEADRGAGDSPQEVDSTTVVGATNTILSVERKGENERELRRTAVPVLVGADWPWFSPEAQGMDTRFTWATVLEGCGPLSSSERALLVSEDAGKVLRWYMCEKAGEYLRMSFLGTAGDQTCTPASDAVVREMFDARTDPIVKALRSEFKFSVTGTTPGKEIVEAFKRYAVEGLIAEKDIPKGRRVGSVMRSAFGRGAKRERDGSNGSKWPVVKRKVEEAKDGN